jgi:RNA polymerase sigma factor (sigma-70 family)
VSCFLAAGEGSVDEIDATELVAALFDHCYTQLVRYAIRSVSDHDLAEDFVQDAFMQLYGALRSGKCIDHPKAWAMCVLRRAVNRHAQERFDYEQLDDLEDLPIPNHESACLSLIADYLCVLSRREEEVLLLRLEAMKYREIADHLGISMNSVNTILARALQKLKKVAQHAAKESVDLYEKKTLNRAS